jgi:hypothetical protein
MTEPCDLTARAARAMIGRKQLSPVELLDSCIARTDAVDHAVNAMVARDDAMSRAGAQAAEQAVMRGEALGALHGLPIGIKDLTATAGLRTTWGSPQFGDHVLPAQNLERLVRHRAVGCCIRRPREHLAKHRRLLREHRGDMPLHRGEPQIGAERRPQRAQIDRRQRRKILGLAHPLAKHGGGQRIAAMIGRHHRQHQRHIVHSARHRPLHTQPRPPEPTAFAGHQPRRRPKPHDPVERGRIAQ